MTRKQNIGITLDETTTHEDVLQIVAVFGSAKGTDTAKAISTSMTASAIYPPAVTRTSEFLTHPVFNMHHSETQMMRYLRSLENKDLSLNTSMISLGSCTMKLNAASELIPVSWPEFGRLHPFAPADQWKGYRQII